MIDIIKREKFIGILRNIPVEKTKRVAEAMYGGGIRIFEVTFNPSDNDTISKVTKQLEIIKKVADDVSLCAGTVVKPEFVTAAKSAGASAIVSPNTDLNIIRLTRENAMTSIPGAFTPSEICTAYNNGADIVKIFPIMPDGIAYLKNIISPLSHIPFITTGGVNPQTVPLLLETGALALAAGVTVVSPEALKNDDYISIKNNAMAHIDAIKEYTKN